MMPYLGLDLPSAVQSGTISRIPPLQISRDPSLFILFVHDSRVALDCVDRSETERRLGLTPILSQ